MVEHVEEWDDPRLDHYRNLTDHQLLRDRGAFIAESRLVVERLLASAFPVLSVLATPVAHVALTDALASHPEVPVYVVSQNTLSRVTGVHIHRGCLAVGRRVASTSVEALVHATGTLVLLEGVGNVDNVGSIFRSVSALGGAGVVLDGACADPLYRKALRTSMGAALQVPFARTEAWLDTLQACRHQGRALLALTPAADATPLRDIRGWEGLWAGAGPALVLGHEGTGLSEATLAACTHRVRIPMRDGVDSLNVATAAAIALYELSDSRAG